MLIAQVTKTAVALLVAGGITAASAVAMSEVTAPVRPQEKPTPAPPKPRPAVRGEGARPIPRLNGITTLLSLTRHERYELAAYRFDWKESGGKKLDGPDLLYGDGSGDPLRVNLSPDDRSWIRDLGPHGWHQLAAVRAALAETAGRGESSVTLKDDHFYRLRIHDRSSNLHILLHVDKIRSGDRVTVSWAIFDPRDFAKASDGEIARPDAPQPTAPRARRGAAKLPPFRHAGRGADLLAFREGSATLFGRTTHDDYERATYSFAFARRDDPDLRVTLNNWDILFGNDRHSELDELSVNMVVGDRCRIRDLGPMSWAGAGKSRLPYLPERTDDEDRHSIGDNVRVVVGHMYLIRTVSYGHYVDAKGRLLEGRVEDFYTLVRVEAHVLNESCTISWRIINAPGSGARPFVQPRDARR